jgi:hypothetical protein
MSTAVLTREAPRMTRTQHDATCELIEAGDCECERLGLIVIVIIKEGK